MNKKYDMWVIAATYLFGDLSGHYKDITNYILETDLTTLGEKGKTPWQSVGRMLRDTVIDGEHVFYPNGDGVYSLWDEEKIRKHKDVQSAYDYIKNNKPKPSYEEIEEENLKLSKENLLLKEKLDSIKKLCDKISQLVN